MAEACNRAPNFELGPGRNDSCKCEPLAEIEQVTVYVGIHDNLATLADDSDKCRLDVPFVHRLKAVQAIASRLFDGHLPR